MNRHTKGYREVSKLLNRPFGSSQVDAMKQLPCGNVVYSNNFLLLAVVIIRSAITVVRSSSTMVVKCYGSCWNW